MGSGASVELSEEAKAEAEAAKEEALARCVERNKLALLSGTAWDVYIVPVEIAIAMDASGREGLCRFSSWVRLSPLYPIRVSLESCTTEVVTFRASIEAALTNTRGWATVNAVHLFDGTMNVATGYCTGSWKRNESRTAPGSSESVNTGGTFSFQPVGNVCAIPPWEPRFHLRHYGHDSEFCRIVRTVLLCHKRRETELSRLPRDVLMIVLKFCAPSLSAHPVIDKMIIADAVEWPKTLDELQSFLEMKELKRPLQDAPPRAEY